MFKKIKKENGFTLIELLVVVAIIGLLSSVVLASLNTAREKARDARRKQDLSQLVRAFEMFYDATGSYPMEGCNPDTSVNDGSCGTSGDSWYSANGMAEEYNGHRVSDFIDPLPLDPINNSTYYYHYEPHCRDGSTKQGYVIQVRLETTGSGYRVERGIQANTPNCSKYCDNPPNCY